MDKNTIKLGRTWVRVMRKEVEPNGREKVREIHSGVIVACTNSFVRVFNPLPRDKGGDVSAYTAEQFAMSGPLSWCVIAGELDANRAIAIPADLRV